MKCLFKILSTGAVLLSAAQALASPSGRPLDGQYELDFFASSGACEKTGYIQTRSGELQTNFRAGGPDQFIFGAFCQDRVFAGDHVTPPESCTDQVWSSTLAKDKKMFEFFVYYSRTIDGDYTKVPLSRFTIKALSENRVQVDSVYFDNNGSVKPVYRCIYQK